MLVHRSQAAGGRRGLPVPAGTPALPGAAGVVRPSSLSKGSGLPGCSITRLPHSGLPSCSSRLQCSAASHLAALASLQTPGGPPWLYGSPTWPSHADACAYASACMYSPCCSHPPHHPHAALTPCTACPGRPAQPSPPTSLHLMSHYAHTTPPHPIAHATPSHATSPHPMAIPSLITPCQPTPAPHRLPLTPHRTVPHRTTRTTPHHTASHPAAPQWTPPHSNPIPHRRTLSQVWMCIMPSTMPAPSIMWARVWRPPSRPST